MHWWKVLDPTVERFRRPRVSASHVPFQCTACRKGEVKPKLLVVRVDFPGEQRRLFLACPVFEERQGKCAKNGRQLFLNVLPFYGDGTRGFPNAIGIEGKAQGIGNGADGRNAMDSNGASHGAGARIDPNPSIDFSCVGILEERVEDFFSDWRNHEGTEVDRFIESQLDLPLI